MENYLSDREFKPKKSRSKRCPNCKSTNTAKILYGLPDYDETLKKQLASGEIVLGGCSVTGNEPIRCCNICDTEF